MDHYVLNGMKEALWLGTRIDVPERSHGSIANPQVDKQEDWFHDREIGYASDVVQDISVLLESVIVQLGGEDKGRFFDNLASSLALTGRESVLQVDVDKAADGARRELLVNAAKVGAGIVQLAIDASQAYGTSTSRDDAALSRLDIRSRCEGHLWTEPVAKSLTSERSSPRVMQLYNEWLHQLILLRDVLIPFENWKEAPINLSALQKQGRGLRALQPLREAFLAELLTRRVRHSSVVRFAKGVFDVKDEVKGYGFQTNNGSVLPAVVGGNLACAPRYLLRWHPAKLVPQAPESNFTFIYQDGDYAGNPLVFIDKLDRQEPHASRWQTGSSLGAMKMAAIEVASLRESTIVLDLTFVTGQSNWRVELGRILRGHRFSHEPLKSGANTDHTAESVNLIFASQIMEQVAPVSAVDGTYRISAEDNSIVALGLLGKLHPQNVILRSGQPWSDVVSSGKQFGSRFVIENFDPSSDCHCSS